MRHITPSGTKLGLGTLVFLAALRSPLLSLEFYLACPRKPSLNSFRHDSHMAQASRALALVQSSVGIQLHGDDSRADQAYPNSLARRMQSSCFIHFLVASNLSYTTKWYTADWDYARTTVYFFCAAIFVFGLANVFFHLRQSSK